MLNSNLPDKNLLQNLSYEDRTFAPSAAFIAQANVKKDIYDLAEADHLSFWETQANRLCWDKKWSQIGNYPLLNGLLVEN
jgi:hypothetical protein